MSASQSLAIGVTGGQLGPEGVDLIGYRVPVDDGYVRASCTGGCRGSGHRAPGGVGCLRAGRGVRPLGRLLTFGLLGASKTCLAANCSGSGFENRPCQALNRLADKAPPRRARPESANTPRCKRLRVWWGGGNVGFRGQLPTLSLPRYPKKKIPQPPQSVSGVWGCLSARQGPRRRARPQPHPSAARTPFEIAECSNYGDAVSVAPKRRLPVRLPERVKALGGRKGGAIPRRPPKTPGAFWTANLWQNCPPHSNSAPKSGW